MLFSLTIHVGGNLGMRGANLMYPTSSLLTDKKEKKKFLSL